MTECPILNDAEHQAALMQIEVLWNAPFDSLGAVELDRITARIEAYECTFLDPVFRIALEGCARSKASR
jgi:hypothetical protein